jgi:aromatic-L-amino-acid/L-tryptophan decarboxylase
VPETTLAAAPPATDPLAVDPVTMREMGHRTVDLLVDLLTDPATPALRRATPAEMARRVPPGAPAEGRGLDAVLDHLRTDVLPYMSRLDHPGYFAFIPACGTWPGALGDLLASALNIYAGSWMEAAGPSRVELVVLDWFKQWIGYPREAAGVLVSGGSAANLTALACAREALLGPMTDRAVVYVSDQGHSSIARTARVLGFRPDQVRVLPTDREQRLRVDALVAAVAADAFAGREPLAVCAAAGSTNTGAVDPLPELAAVCRERGLWLHVDGAYGAFAALSDRGRAALHGIELADSVTLDPHKWLYQPFECGALLVRDGALLRRAFEIVPEYLQDAAVDPDEVNFCDLGLQLSRSSHALKVWLSIQTLGLDAFREAIDRCLDLAALAQAHVESRPELELMAPARLGITCFRRRGLPEDGEERVAARNAALVAGFEATGQGLVSSTRLRGRYAVRLCVMNHTSTAADVSRVLDWFADAPLPEGSADGAALATPVRHAGVRSGWLGDPVVAPEELAALGLFAGLDAEQLAAVASWAREQHVAPGAEVTRAWDASRDFYVVLAGTAAVERDGTVVATLGPGAFFGELAALDWGAGYGYARQATVRAGEPLRLLVLAPAHLHQLVAIAPAVAERIHAAVRERL